MYRARLAPKLASLVMQLTTVGTYYQNSKVITWARCVVVLWFLRDFGKTEIQHGVDYG